MRRLATTLLLLGALAGVARAEEGTLVARVTDADGKALPDAGVLVWNEEGSWSGRTDDEGVWRKTLAPGTYAGIVRAEGWVGTEQRDLDVEAGLEAQARWTLARGVPFQGRVLDAAGDPVPHATVTVVPGGSFEGWNEVFPGRPPFAREWTDDAGRFSVGGIPPGQIATVVVDAEGLRQTRVGIRADEDAVRPAPLVITLHAGARSTGRVVDEQGNGVADALVYVVPSDMEELRTSPTMTVVADGKMIQALSARTNPSGWFQVENLAPGTEYVAVVDAEGFARYAESETFAVGEDGTCPLLTITVRPGATILVRVLGEGGALVGDAKLVLGSHMGATTREAADDDGVYRFPDVPPGRHALHVEHAAYLPTIVAVETTAGEATTVTVELDRGARIRGVLLDGAGRPVPAMRLGVETRLEDPVSGWTSWSSASDETDADGRFDLGPVAPGTYELETYSTRFELPKPTKLEAPVDDAHVVGGWLGTATLRLLRPDGTPYEGTVWVWRPEPGGLGAATGSPAEVEDGHLELDAIRAEPTPVEIVPDDFVPLAWELEATAGGNVDLGEIVLDPGTTVRGRVVAPDGTPVAEADVTLGRQRVESDAEGRFVLEHVPRGSAVLELRADGYAKSWPHVEVGEKPGDVVLTLSRGARVHVRVCDAEGEPLPGARVSIDRLVDGHWRDAAVGRADETGVFQGPVAAGRVRFVLLEVDEDGHTRLGPNLAELDLVEGSERELKLTVPAR